jgi:hypothetical protein
MMFSDGVPPPGHHQPGRELEPRHHESGIDATLKRSGIQVMLAYDGLLILISFPSADSISTSVVFVTADLAAHDAGGRSAGVIVGDHARRRACRCGRRAPAKSRRRGRGTTRLPLTFSRQTWSGRARS